MTLASPGWIFVRESSAAGEHFVRPKQQSLIALDNGTLTHFPLEANRPERPSLLPALGTFGLLGAIITPLEGVSALQVTLEGGHVAHIEAADEIERDQWVLELNLAGLRAASRNLDLVSRAPSPPPPRAVEPAVGSSIGGGYYARRAVLPAAAAPPAPPAAAAQASAARMRPPHAAATAAPSSSDAASTIAQPSGAALRLPPPAALPPPVTPALKHSRTSPAQLGSRTPPPPLSPPTRGGAAAAAAPPSAPNWPAVASFVEGASVFAISRMWSDLLAAFLFQLQPMPFCGGFLDTPCTPTAPSGQLFAYALGCVPLAALAKHLAESRFGHIPASRLVPSMAMYFVGWAVGNAFVQLRTELIVEAPGLCSAYSGCTVVDLAFALCVTLGACCRCPHAAAHAVR